MWPLMDVSDVIGTAFLPTDGQASPADITQALARGARMAGAELREKCPVTRIETDGERVTAVHTPEGRIACEKVVVCAGQWTRALAATVGVTVPLVSVEHQYMVTEPFGVPSNLPTLRDPDRLTYWKEEVGGLVMGGYEPNGIPWAVDGIPEPFDFQLLESRFDHFEQLIELALPRVPALQDAGVKQLINGPESFTPDGNFILGEAPELKNFFVGAGFNAFGIASGGGAGMALAEWVVAGEPPFDLWSVDIRRFGRPHFDTDWVRSRTMEAYGKHYTMAWPSEEHASARPCRMSPLYDRLNTAGAVFGEKLGWERPNWFASTDDEPRDIYTFGLPNWHDAVGREHRATRKAAAVFDQTSFAKFLFSGPDAEAALGWIAANDVAKSPGRLIYTQMLNDRGGIEADVTCARLDPQRYYIVSGTGFATRDFNWILRNIPDGMNAQLTDVTSAFSVLSLFGPRARDILQAITSVDISNDAFPFGTVQDLPIAGARVMALRVTYVGELGWELHVPTESALSVYAALMNAGAPLGLVNAGYRAIETLRLEKGYRAWGAELSPFTTPFEAGLGWACKLSGQTAFKGRAAIEAQRQEGVHRLLACFTTDDDPGRVIPARSTIYRDGVRVGYLTSAGFGHSVGKWIGFGFVSAEHPIDKEHVRSGTYELEVATERVPAQVHTSPLYDPGLSRVKC